MAVENFDRVLKEARAGRREAWAQLYASSGPAALGYLRARNIPDAEDQVCESFLDAVRELSRFEGDERAFHLWLWTIAHRRAEASRPKWPRRSSRSNEVVAAFEGEDAEHRAARQRVREILGALPGDQQAVILIEVLSDLSVDEVSEVMEKRPASVRALHRRGHKALRKKLTAGKSGPGADAAVEAFASATRKLFLETVGLEIANRHIAAITQLAVAAHHKGPRRPLGKWH